MNKGDWVVCVHHRFGNFTKGKKYQLLSDSNSSTLDIESDKGERGYTSLYGFEGDKFITYFDSIENVRNIKLEKLGI
jgi:hypothetical protein